MANTLTVLVDYTAIYHLSASALSCAALQTALTSTFGSVAAYTCTAPLLLGDSVSVRLGGAKTASTVTVTDYVAATADLTTTVSALDTRVSVLETKMTTVLDQTTPIPLDQQEAKTLFYSGMTLILIVYLLALSIGKTLQLMGWRKS